MQKHKIFGLTLTLVLIFSFSAVAIAGKYNEAPMLKRLVAAGELPPIEERLPDEPVVVEPLEKIGEYGGTLHVYTTSPANLGWPIMSVVSSDGLLRFKEDLSWGHPNVLESYELAYDARSITLHLRKGLKWSDGYPFTVDDFLYFYEHVLLNKELTPHIPGWAVVEGEVVQFKKIDDYTMRWEFAAPYPIIVNYLCGAVGGQPMLLFRQGSYQAAHYAKKFHPDFIGKEKAIQMAKEAGFDGWSEYYWHKTDVFFSLPTVPGGEPGLLSYVCVEKTIDRWVFERNPYYWKVDTEGNQLPYIDRIILHLVADPNIIEGKLITGEVDFMSGNIEKMPLYVDNAEEGGYRVLLWRSGDGSPAHIELNLTSEDLVLREIFQDIRFRKALSLAIDREEINKIIYFDLATPRAHTVPPFCEYFKPEYAEVYIDYDPDRANKLLDEMGLDKKNKEGFRLRSDGEQLTIILETPPLPTVSLFELISEYCKDIGVDVRVKEETFGLFRQRAMAGKVDMRIGGTGQDSEPGFSIFAQHYVPIAWGFASPWCTKWSQWYVTGGTKGEEPPEEIMNLINWWEKMKLAMTEEERIKWGQKITQSHADNIWMIGTVGMPPVPLLVNKNLRNIPSTGYYTWSTALTGPYSPEQFFLKGAEPLKEASPILYK